MKTRRSHPGPNPGNLPQASPPRPKSARETGPGGAMPASCENGASTLCADPKSRFERPSRLENRAARPDPAVRPAQPAQNLALHLSDAPHHGEKAFPSSPQPARVN